MSHQPISLSPDLKKLRDEGYDLEVRKGYLLVKDVPYVNSQKEIKRGLLVCALRLSGDIADTPDDHVAHFHGEYPCRADGAFIEKIRNQSDRRTLVDEVVIDHSFSAKPKPDDNYPDFYAKVTTYAAILSGPAQVIDPTVTAKTFPAISAEAEESDSTFNYIDTASSRAEIVVVTKKLELKKVAIIGLGGTGSYVLDFVAKTPVKEIHIFDGDVFSQHNAFRSPGAPSIEELREKPSKVSYFGSLYSKMHRGIIGHEAFITDANLDQLQDMEFVFLCLDNGRVKKMIVQALEDYDIPFVDVGMGIMEVDGSLGGILRVTASTPGKRDHIKAKGRIPFSDGGAHNDYAKNIQVADLNALNASLAVMKWKKHFGFYRDFHQEHFSTYTIDGNLLTSEDRL